MNGGFTLAIKAGVPICPITIDGTWSIMPRTTLRIKQGNIRITMHRLIETAGLTMRDRRTLREKVKERIRSTLSAPARRYVDAT
jgi:1-acyl-sn-glycerol-3-phosphate acyltransferase